MYYTLSGGNFMSRTVETVRYSKKVYFYSGDFDEDGIDWEDLIGNVKYDLERKYKSLYEPNNKWLEYPFRETMILLQNDHVKITVSEYCGVGVFCIFYDDNSECPELSERWFNQNVEKIKEIIKQYCESLRHVATFSNGEAIYERL